jgi:AraC family transcriptional regulator
MSTTEGQTGVLVRAMSEDAIRNIVHTLPYRTSCTLNWPGVEVHRYHIATVEGPEHTLPYLGVFLPHVQEPFHARLEVGGRTLSARFTNQSVSVIPPGILRQFSRDSAVPYELTAILIDPLMLAGISRAQTGLDFPNIIPQFGIVDPLIRSIGMMLDNEMESENPNPRIYAESLLAALVAQIFSRYTDRQTGARNTGAHGVQIRRAVEYINQHMDGDLRLEDIAKVANMSKYHFAKVFRQVVGMPPHQYLVRMRVEKARKLLIESEMSITEVANLVGYEDTGQFSEQFLKIVGATPHRYRLTN